MKKKALTFSFLGLLGVLTVCNLIAPKREFSENENRYLTQFPEFSLQTLLDGSFNKGFENYVTDQFLLRDQWVGMKSFSEQMMQKKDSGGVYFAKDNYLIETFQAVDEKRYHQNLKFVSDFTKRMEEQGVNTQTMLIPTAASILEDKLPSYHPDVDQSDLLMEAKKEVPNLLDMTSVLKNHSDEPIYYRTDHHWTSLGAYYVYQDWIKEKGMEPHDQSDYEISTLSDDFLGTTYSKVGYYPHKPDSLIAYYPKNLGEISINSANGKEITHDFYARSYLEQKDKYSVYLNGNQPVTTIQTPNQNGKKLLLLKDSYANTFAQFAIGDFEEVSLIDLRYYRQPVSQFVTEHGITDVLFLYNLKGFTEDANLFSLK